jgi:hypothetical protein
MATYTHDALDITTIMTANNLPSPMVASASSELSADYAAWRAFDHLSSTDVSLERWTASSTAATGWLKIDLGSGNEKALTGYTISENAGVGRINCPMDFTLKGSNNDSTWNTLDTQTGINWIDNTNQMKTFTLGATSSVYRYFLLDITDNDGAAGYLAIGELELLGATTTARPQVMLF